MVLSILSRPCFPMCPAFLRKQERWEKMSLPGASHYTFVKRQEPFSSFGNHILQVSTSPRWLQVLCGVMITYNYVISTVGDSFAHPRWVRVPKTSQICPLPDVKIPFLRKKSSSSLRTQLFWHGLEVLRQGNKLYRYSCFYGNTSHQLGQG